MEDERCLDCGELIEDGGCECYDDEDIDDFDTDDEFQEIKKDNEAENQELD